jgi:hypothetical protein
MRYIKKGRSNVWANEELDDVAPTIRKPLRLCNDLITLYKMRRRLKRREQETIESPRRRLPRICLCDIQIKVNEEDIEKWAADLAKLARIRKQGALDIAYQKIAFLEDRIRRLQKSNSSNRKLRILKELIKSDPLPPIRNVNHAFVVLQAYHRHAHTNYERLLERAKKLAARGIINYKNVKKYAREALQEDPDCFQDYLEKAQKESKSV